MISTKVKPTFSRYGNSLRYRDFRWVMLGSLGGQSAYWALIIARGVLVLEMTGSSALVGVATFAAMVPRFLMPPVAGYLADRFDRRTVLVVAYVLQFFNVLALAGLAFADLLTVGILIALSLLNGTFRAFQMTATQALVPNLVSKDDLLNAIALNQLSLQGARLVGPALIAPALFLGGTSAAFLACAVLYVLSIVCVTAIHTRSTGALTKGAGVLQSLVEAGTYSWSDPQLRVLFVLIALHCAMTMSFETILPVLSQEVLSNPENANTLKMAVGGGALIGVLAISGTRKANSRGMILLITGALSGASMLILAMARDLPTAMLGAGAMGATQAAFMAIAGAMVQSLAPDAMRGRITGFSHIIIGGTMAVLNLVNGFAADAIGVSNVLWILGLGFTAIVIASLAIGPLRNIYRGVAPVPAAAG
ncbi:MAG: MFS transporter [Chloroflexi bacterium]|nr:MFS transporter [Chloroflexota bacterium]